MDLNAESSAEMRGFSRWLPRGAMDLNLTHRTRPASYIWLAPSWSHGSKLRLLYQLRLEYRWLPRGAMDLNVTFPFDLT